MCGICGILSQETVREDQVSRTVVVVCTRRFLAREYDVIPWPEVVLGNGELKATFLPKIDLSWRNMLFLL